MKILTARKFYLLVIVGLCIGLVSVTSPILYARAQGNQPGWTIVQQVPGYLDDTFTPFLMADKNRTVHAFANQWVGTEDRQLAIVYRKWTLDGGWTSPVDILLWPEGEVIIQGAFLNNEGILHIIFWGGKDSVGNLYYSNVPVALAERAPAWSSPKVIGPNAIYPASAKLQGDAVGNLVAIYSSRLDENGVYSVQSHDGGESWSDPAPIYLTGDTDNIPYSIQMTVDSANQMHAAWNVVNSVGNDLSLHYARYAAGSWSEAILLDEKVNQAEFFGPSYPSIATSGNEVLVFYNSGNPNANGPVGLGRPVQMMRASPDGGITWGKPITPFPQFQGRSGEHTLSVDSNGVVHAIFIQRIDQSINGQYRPIGGIWHSEYRDTRWTEPELIPIPFAAHDIRSVISQGNVLLAAWHADPGVGEFGVYNSFKILDAPELPVETPTIPENTPALVATSVISPTLTSGENNLQPPVGVSNNWLAAEPAGNHLNPGVLLTIGLAPVVFVLVAFVLVRRLNQ
jgi:hypothetical protein